jgi:hypothetical protein
MPTQICRGFTDHQWKGLKLRLIRNGVIEDDKTAWDCAIQVFRRRIEERFLSSIETLELADSGYEAKETPDAPPDCSTLPADSKNVVVPGFAIMALCCLLVETLAGFCKIVELADNTEKTQTISPENGQNCPFPGGECIKPKPRPEGGARIVEFLQRDSFGQSFNSGIGRKFVHGVRDGIFHEAETRGWLISRDHPEDRVVESLGKDRYRLNRTKFYKALKTEFEIYIKDLGDFQNRPLRQRFIKKMQDIVDEC